ncbi:MAG: DUF4197 domain-containing protein [Flavobacterium sp.]|nr:DUF4197 domain-containing protein [Flavobacterium sp.]
MKKNITLAIATTVLAASLHAQGLKGLIKKATDVVKSGTTSGLTTDEVGMGLKEALAIGVKKSAEQLSGVDGFLGNAAVKILLPPEAQQVEQKLRALGFNKQVDDAIVSMNRAAEDAAKSAAPIFVNAIASMSITDAFGILKGGDTAATVYLKSKTTTPLTTAFAPVIDSSLAKVGASQLWAALFAQYNKIPFVKKVNPDLKAYVTDRALAGMFYQVAQEEAKIRKNPAAQTTELLKKVFGTK